MSAVTEVRPTPLLVATLAKRQQEVEQCWKLHDPEATKEINKCWEHYNEQLERLYKQANTPFTNPIHNLIHTIHTTRRDYLQGRFRKPLAQRLDYLKKRKDRVRRNWARSFVPTGLEA